MGCALPFSWYICGRLDPNYVKAYYRRASANMALGKHKLAVKDLRQVAKAHPADKVGCVPLDHLHWCGSPVLARHACECHMSKLFYTASMSVSSDFAFVPCETASGSHRNRLMVCKRRSCSITGMLLRHGTVQQGLSLLTSQDCAFRHPLLLCCRPCVQYSFTTPLLLTNSGTNTLMDWSRMRG